VIGDEGRRNMVTAFSESGKQISAEGLSPTLKNPELRVKNE
jgi:hypothetical protein